MACLPNIGCIQKVFCLIFRVRFEVIQDFEENGRKFTFVLILSRSFPKYILHQPGISVGVVIVLKSCQLPVGNWFLGCIDFPGNLGIEA